MTDTTQPIPSEQELPLCKVCSLQPTPQSVGSWIAGTIAATIILIKWQVAVIIVVGQFCWAKTGWYCPQCQRQVEVRSEVEGIKDNFIIRAGNCMVMLSKTKFRIIATALIAYLLYRLVDSYNRPPNHPQTQIAKTWPNFATYCGYHAYLQNPYSANSLLHEYQALGQWDIQGIVLTQQPLPEGQSRYIHIKMDPSQFSNPHTEDIVIIAPHDTASVQPGEIVKFAGNWSGRQGPQLRFIARRVTKTNEKKKLEDVKVLSLPQLINHQLKNKKASLSVEEDKALLAQTQK